MNKSIFIISFMPLVLSSCFSYDEPKYEPIRNVDDSFYELPGEEFTDGDDINLKEDWELFWNDEFDGTDEELDLNWVAENMASGHIDCSRWRENAVISDGTLKIVYKHEYKGGKEYTSASLNTRETFLYGYLEARYKYAGAYATNNSFWLHQPSANNQVGYGYEVDINEGKYPNIVATNVQTCLPDGTRKMNGKTFLIGSSPIQEYMFEPMPQYRFLKFESKDGTYFHMKEFGVFKRTTEGYPDPRYDDEWKDDPNRIKYKVLEISGKDKGVYSPIVINSYNHAICDSKFGTSWVTQKDGDKWVTIDLGDSYEIGCIKFLSGYTSAANKDDLSSYTTMVSSYKIYGRNSENEEWKEFITKDFTEDVNFAEEYHTYGLEWTEDELIFYLDRKEIRRQEHTHVRTPSAILLSGAIVDWAGELIPEQIDGSTMEVDYVRVYKRKGEIEENQ